MIIGKTPISTFRLLPVFFCCICFFVFAAVGVSPALCADSSEEDSLEAESVGTGDMAPNAMTPETMSTTSTTTTTTTPESSSANQNETQPDSFFKDIQKVTVDLFSGAASYGYPLWTPPGRNGIQPRLSLSYSSNMRQFDSLAGYGWSFPTNAIYRSTERGVNYLYDDNDFSSDIWGEYSELILVNAAAEEYRAKTESGFTRYLFRNNAWVVTDTAGVTYFFGTDSSSRQEDPNDASRIYKWLLNKVQDANGNYMTFAYSKDGGQVYPSIIRYTGHGTDPGIYEVRFRLEDRDAYTSYERGFAVTTDSLIGGIDLYSHHSGTAELIRTYNFEYDIQNNAIVHLSRITIEYEDYSLPPVSFQYHDKTNTNDYSAIHLLKQVDYPYGAKEFLLYKPSTAYRVGADLGNSKLPFVIHTLFQKQLQPNPNGPVHTTEYAYTGGHYYYDNLDAFKKQYAGFHEVRVTDPAGNVQKIFFHQSEFSPDNTQSTPLGEFDDHISKKGRAYRVEQYDNSAHLYELSLYKWSKQALTDADPNEDRHFVFLSREVQASYDGNESYRAKAKEMVYDSYGNVLIETDYGRVQLWDTAGNFNDIENDKLVINKTYAHSASLYIHRLIARELRTDINGVTVGDVKYYYDSLGLGQVSTGNLTKTEVLTEAPSRYVAETMAYDAYGMPISKTNARGYTSTILYDQLHLYPSVVTNALGQKLFFNYHYPTGQKLSVTDQNALIQAYEYDVFGRIIREKISDPKDLSALLVLNDYSYQMNAWPVSITKNAYSHVNDAQNYPVVVTHRTYYDGLGRPIQVKQEARGSQFVSTSKSYDEMGNLKKETLPVYTDTGSYQAPTAQAYGTTYVYDALSRPVSQTHSLGTLYISYDDWEKSVVDEYGTRKDFVYDARTNLSTVREYLGGEAHETKYTYNPNNHLIKIEDANGDVRSMTYDLLGRRTSLEDVHVVGDTTYGTWRFEYDVNGNLIKETDPKGQVVRYAYDSLDRIVSIDNASHSGSEIAYQYDAGDYGIGRLHRIDIAVGTYYDHSPKVSEIFTYDVLGNTLEEEKIIDDVIFVTGFQYSLQGKVGEIAYPDGSHVRYILDNAGWVQKVQGEADGEFADILTWIDYSPHGKMSRIRFANGVVTNDTFDVSKLYRLTRRQTLLGSRKLQDLAYEYDPVGNLMYITDTSETNTRKISDYQYDDLYRLVQVTVAGVASGQNYTRDYRYDAVGNMLEASDVGLYVYAGGEPNTCSAVNSNPHAVTSAGGTQFTYDDNGNMVSDSEWDYAYNFQDYLVESDDGTDTIRYLYDAKGNRVQKRNMNTNVRTYYANKYYDLEGGVGKKYVFVHDQKIATIPVVPSR